MKVGLYFGSFNPVHTGHMIIANLVLQEAALEQLWMVISPQNPLKQKASLARDFDRLHLVNLAIGDNSKIKASNIEFGLPKPSYTIDTVIYLKEKYPEYQFCLVIGGDNLFTLPKWKNYEQLLSLCPVYVYARPGFENEKPEIQHPNIHVLSGLPLLDISSTYIRECIRKKFSVQYLVPDAVYDYLENSSLYKK